MPETWPMGLFAVFFFAATVLCCHVACGLYDTNRPQLAALPLFLAGFFFGWACWLTVKGLGV